MTSITVPATGGNAPTERDAVPVPVVVGDEDAVTEGEGDSDDDSAEEVGDDDADATLVGEAVKRSERKSATGTRGRHSILAAF